MIVRRLALALALTASVGSSACEKASPNRIEATGQTFDANTANDAQSRADAQAPSDASPRKDAATPPDATASSDAAPIAETEWDRCTGDAQCTYAISPCTQQKHPANKSFKSKLNKKLNDECREQPMLGLLSARDEVTCKKGRCVISPRAYELGTGVGGGLGGGGISDVFKDIAKDPDEKSRRGR